VKTLFISDLHLSEDDDRLTALFLEFLKEGVGSAQALYVLGDLFEAWVGDDDLSPFNQGIIAGLRALADRGVAVFAMHGNRDFLLGSGFERMTGCRLLPDPAMITLSGTPTLLMHGDTLCTDDIEYHRFRVQVRDPEAQRRFSALPLEERQRIARHYREQSRLCTGGKPEEIMDVNRQAVLDVVREYGVTQLIHGHTHRPGVHCFPLDGRLVRRIVLGDWGSRASVLVCEDGHCRLTEWPSAVPSLA
jgi:UDP-2,3-diacylglucosamine hydrolase